MNGSSWIGRQNAPEPPAGECYGCRIEAGNVADPGYPIKHMCSKSIDPGQVVTPDAIERWNRAEEHRGHAYTARAGDTVAEPPPELAYSYDPAELTDLVQELGDHIAARVERLVFLGRVRDLLWIVAAATGAMERLATLTPPLTHRAASAGDALRELSELAREVDERLAAATLPAAASTASPAPTSSGLATATPAGAPDPSGRRVWRPRLRRVAYAAGGLGLVAGGYFGAYYGWLAWG